MKKLSQKAKDLLGIIHNIDVLKVLEQIKVVALESSQCAELQKLTDAEYEQLINLLIKYKAMLNTIK